MTGDWFVPYERTLKGLERKGRKRTLSQLGGIDFTSNDYLGLSSSARLKKALSAAMERGTAIGSGGSRLLRGNHPEHEALEERAAAFFGAERAIYFASGYAANTALFSTLPKRNDLILADALIHASLHHGIEGSRAKAVFVPHNDVANVEDLLRRWRSAGATGIPWIAVESLYSMDGDQAPLEDLLSLVERYDGILVIDEAHATGVYGPNGRGLAAKIERRENVILVHTCGKALGVSGALVCSNRVICEYLVNRAREFIYSTAPSPLMAACVREALTILDDEPHRRDELERLSTFANTHMAKTLSIPGSGSQILPVLIGDNARCVRIASRMQQEGFDIRPIRPPTVAEGTARLRIAVTRNVDVAAVRSMFDCLGSILDEERV